jgi:hypothetical protein
MKKPRLTRHQKALLGLLCLDTWTVPPRYIKAATVLSLEARGLIRMRSPGTYMWRYSECECQLTDKGMHAFTDFVHWEMAARGRRRRTV